MSSVVVQLTSGMIQFWMQMMNMQLQDQTVSIDFIIIIFLNCHPVKANSKNYSGQKKNHIPFLLENFLFYSTYKIYFFSPIEFILFTEKEIIHIQLKHLQSHKRQDFILMFHNTTELKSVTVYQPGSNRKHLSHASSQINDEINKIITRMFHNYK